MDLRQLRYFVTVAEELNFSRAALRLHMSQPPLSHQIKLLEEELGVTLLARNSRHVRLTPAGVTFMRDCRALLDQAQAASNRAKMIALGEAGTLRVGMATSAIDQVMPSFIKRFRQHHTLAQLVIRDMGSEEQVRALAQDRLDLCFIHSLVTARSMMRRSIYSEVFAIVLPVDHPLVSNGLIELRDLAEEPMVTFSRDHRSALFDSLVAACMNAGFSPRLVHVARHPMSLFQMVRQGLGVSIVPNSYGEVAGGGVHVQPLPLSAGVLQIDAVWRADSTSELLRHVIEHVLPPQCV